MRNLFFQLFHNSKLRFLFVGGSTAVIYFGILYLIHERLGLGENASVAISYGSSTAFHFLANKFFVHREPALEQIHVQLMKYAFLLGINYGITFIITNAALHLHFSIYVGVLASVVVTLVFTFVIMKYLIFRARA